MREYTVSWFNEITRNPYVDVALLVDNAGRLLATSNRAGSEAQRVAAMIKAAEVLARGLSAELGRGDMNSLQLSTQSGHLLVMPVGIAHYLIVLTNRHAPLELIFTYMQRLIDRMGEEEIAAALRDFAPTRRLPSPLEEISPRDLIDAVSEWLHNGGDVDDPRP